MVIHFLKKGFHKFYGGLGHNKLTLTTIDCVWLVELCWFNLRYIVDIYSRLHLNQNG